MWTDRLELFKLLSFQAPELPSSRAWQLLTMPSLPFHEGSCIQRHNNCDPQQKFFNFQSVWKVVNYKRYICKVNFALLLSILKTAVQSITTTPRIE